MRTGSRGHPRRLFLSVREDQDLDEDPDIIVIDDEGDDDVFANVAEIPVRDAMILAENEEWREAIQSEVESLIKNGTFKIVRKPQNQNVVRSRILY